MVVPVAALCGPASWNHAALHPVQRDMPLNSVDVLGLIVLLLCLAWQAGAYLARRTAGDVLAGRKAGVAAAVLSVGLVALAIG
jgi:hypothetical protein